MSALSLVLPPQSSSLLSPPPSSVLLSPQSSSLLSPPPSSVLLPPQSSYLLSPPPSSVLPTDQGSQNIVRLGFKHQCFESFSYGTVQCGWYQSKGDLIPNLYRVCVCVCVCGQRCGGAGRVLLYDLCCPETHIPLPSASQLLSMH